MKDKQVMIKLNDFCEIKRIYKENGRLIETNDLLISATAKKEIHLELEEKESYESFNQNKVHIKVINNNYYKSEELFEILSLIFKNTDVHKLYIGNDITKSKPLSIEKLKNFEIPYSEDILKIITEISKARKQLNDSKNKVLKFLKEKEN